MSAPQRDDTAPPDYAASEPAPTAPIMPPLPRVPLPPPDLARWLAARRVAPPVYRRPSVPADAPWPPSDWRDPPPCLDAVLEVAYAGPRFSGWQRQVVAPSSGSGRGAGRQVRTVEGALVAAVADVTGVADPPLQALSRTDADVSARCQLVRLRLPAPALAARALGAAQLADALNARLSPQGVLVTRARLALPSQVQLRNAVRAKVYSYYVGCGHGDAGVFKALAHLQPHLVFVPQRLDAPAMAAATAALLGTHDFVGFTTAGRREAAARGSDGRGRARGGGRQGAAELAADESTPAAPLDHPGSSSAASQGIEDDDAAADDGDDGAPLSSRRPCDTVRTVHAAYVTALRPEEVHTGLARPQEEGGVLVRAEERAPTEPCAAAAHPLEPLPKRQRGSGPDSASADGGATTEALKPGAAVNSLSPAAPPPSPCVLRFTFVGDGFLRHQLRRVVGALLAVGRGDLPPSFIGDVLASRTTHGGLADGVLALDTSAGATDAASSSLSPSPLSPAARARLRGGGGDVPYVVAPGRGLWLERLVMVDEPLPLTGRAAAVDAGGAGSSSTAAGTTRLWTDPLWSNNPTPGFVQEWGLRLVSELAA